jgi:hypothetical protein
MIKQFKRTRDNPLKSIPEKKSKYFQSKKDRRNLSISTKNIKLMAFLEIEQCRPPD